MKQKLFLISLILASLSFSLFRLASQPSFISDEASIGYNAYSILKTGRDEWGQKLPLTFKAFGEHKLPAYIYLSLPFIKLFGLSEFSTRLLSVFAGAFSIFLVFKIAEKFFSRLPSAPYFVSLLFAFNPWHLQVSRLALEANLAVFFFLLGSYLFLKEKNWSAFFYWALCFYTYNSFRVLIPLFLLILFLKKYLCFKKAFLQLLFFISLLLPLFFSGFQGSGERFLKTAFWLDPGFRAGIEFRRNVCLERIPFFLCRLAYNRPVSGLSQFLKNYFTHFSPQFLFSKGAQLAQYSLPDFGVLYALEMPFLVLGFFALAQKKAAAWLIILWLFLAPLPTSLTGSPHPVRSLPILPALTLISGLGLAIAQRNLKKSPLIGKLINFGFLVSFLVFTYRYFVIYPQSTGSIWQAGYPPLYQYLGEVEDSFDEIRISKFYGEPHIFYLFSQKINPASYQNNLEVIRYNRQDDWVNVDRIGKYRFCQLEDEPDCLIFDDPSQKVLLVLAPGESPFSQFPRQVISYPNAAPAFWIY